MNAIQAFENLPNTPEQIREFSRQIIDQLNNGEVDPLKFKVFLKGIEQVMDTIKPVLDRLAREQAEQYGQRSFTLGYAKIELKEAGTRYDYTQCGYPAWQRSNEESKAAAAKLREVEKFLQAVKAPVSINDEDTGEVVTIYPPAKSSTSIVQITLPKIEDQEDKQ